MQVLDQAPRVVEDKPGAPPAESGAPGRGAALDAEIERVVSAYRQAGRALRASDPANWAGGLTMAQVRVLFFLGRSGPVSVGQVATGLGIAQPTATETLERLVRAGLVERTGDPCDRRVVRNALSTKGREVIDRPWETRRAVLASALQHATPEERDAVARGLEVLCRLLVEAERAAFPGSATTGSGEGSAAGKGEKNA